MNRIDYIFIGLCLILLFSCKKRDTTIHLEPTQNGNIYALKTTEAYNIFYKSAYSGGIFNSDLGNIFTSYGICWNYFPDPNINSNNKILMSGTTPYQSFTYSCQMTNLQPNLTCYVRAFATNNTDTVYGNQITFQVSGISVQQKLNYGETPKQIYDSGYPLDSLYGKIYKNGYIFYFNPNNGSGMVASTSVNVIKVWGSENVYISGTLDDLGAGSDNTNCIINGPIITNQAARICRSTVSNNGWFLPSKEELNYMYLNLKKNGYGSFYNVRYWSSTQSSTSYACSRDFTDGTATTNNKSESLRTRCVMSFIN